MMAIKLIIPHINHFDYYEQKAIFIFSLFVICFSLFYTYYRSHRVSRHSTKLYFS